MATGSKKSLGSAAADQYRQRTMLFRLKPAAPFRLDFTAWALRRRTGNLVDRWDGRTYRRVLGSGEKLLEAAVTQSGTPDLPRLRVQLVGGHVGAKEKKLAQQTLENLLGLNRDLSSFYRIASEDPALGPLAARFRGMKPPRFASLFEALANAIACQQVSLSLGILLLNRLTKAYGPSLQTSDGLNYAFPPPERIAELEPAALRELGFSRQKGRALIELARLSLRRTNHLLNLEKLPNEEALERLLELRGIGRWSAEYTLLRGLGRLDVYPGDDVGAHNNLRRWLNLTGPLDHQRVRLITARWQPYAGLVYFHMLLDGLAAAGRVRL